MHLKTPGLNFATHCWKSIIRRLNTAEALSEESMVTKPKALVGSPQKLLKVSIIGLPNAGKSTLINALMDRKVFATSSKVHTTRANARAIFTRDDCQVIFLDTPGLVSFKERQRFNLERSFLKDHRSSFSEADVIGVVHNVGDPHTREHLDIKVVKLLEEFGNIPSFLVLNKIDILKSKRKLLDVTRIVTENCINGKPIASTNMLKKASEYRGWPNFKEVFMVSSLTGDGLEDVKDYLLAQAKPAEWKFPEEVWTDQKAEDLVLKVVKAKLLDFLPQEIPYNMKPQLELFDRSEKGTIVAVVLVRCPTARVAKLVAGGNDGRLKNIMAKAQAELQDAFQTFVRITIVLDAPDEAK